jgi:NADPH-dependent 2,4-dienoyl-CoA reductase/sulfur reductase-like enzyme
MTVCSISTDRRESVTAEGDVLVVGGGATGVAAAVTAARQVLRRSLWNATASVGGAVAGLSGTICGMYEASDDPNAPPNQIVHGFFDEFANRMSERGGLTPPVRYGKTFTRVHDPLVWRETADAML